jgi:beta-glucanase (GH16 family)
MWLLVIFKYKFNNKKSNVCGKKIIFEDDFNYLNRNKWRTDAYYGLRFHPGNITEKGKAPDNYYSDLEDYFKCEESIIQMKTTDDPIEINYVDWEGKNWGNWKIPVQTSQLDSSNSFMIKYGIFEARCKQPKSKNMWPAFWLASTQSWPPEIDIFEVWTRNKGFTTTIHWGHDSDETRTCRGGWIPTPKLDEDFHIYTCVWSKKTIKVYFDNILVRVTPTPPNFIYPMHVIINSAIDKISDIKNTTFPNYFEVDYVRVYELDKNNKNIN